MDQQILMYPSAQQLQGIIGQLAEIEERLQQVNLAVVRLAEQLATRPAVDDVIITSEDTARVQVALAKPRSPEIVRMLARADKLAIQFSRLPNSQQEAIFAQSLEKSQADALAKGVALADEREAARGD